MLCKSRVSYKRDADQQGHESDESRMALATVSSHSSGFDQKTLTRYSDIRYYSNENPVLMLFRV